MLAYKLKATIFNPLQSSFISCELLTFRRLRLSNWRKRYKSGTMRQWRAPCGRICWRCSTSSHPNGSTMTTMIFRRRTRRFARRTRSFIASFWTWPRLEMRRTSAIGWETHIYLLLQSPHHILSYRLFTLKNFAENIISKSKWFCNRLPVVATSLAPFGAVVERTNSSRFQGT